MTVAREALVTTSLLQTLVTRTLSVVFGGPRRRSDEGCQQALIAPLGPRARCGHSRDPSRSRQTRRGVEGRRQSLRPLWDRRQRLPSHSLSRLSDDRRLKP